LRNRGTSQQTVSYWLLGPCGTVLEGAWYSWRKREATIAAVLADGSRKHATHTAKPLAKTAQQLLEELRNADRDGDGRLHLQEWQQARRDPWPKEFDGDQSGTLEGGEIFWYASVQAGHESRWHLLSRLLFSGTETQYFVTVAVPRTEGKAPSFVAETRPILVTLYREHWDRSDVGVLLQSIPVKLDPGQEATHAYRIFAGPRDEEAIAASLQDREVASLVMAYGMVGGIARLMLAILRFFHSLIPNWGVAIILLTALVRLCLYPLTRRQIISSMRIQKKMALIKPELDRLRQKYKNDREALGRATMELYRKHGLNPLAPFQGCLPLLLQMPIFIGLWRALSSAVELRQAHFFLWIDNLAAPDMLFPFGVELPLLGPYFNLLPILAIVLLYVQQKLYSPPSPDPEVQAQQKLSLVIISVMMLFFFYTVPSGLCLYFLASSLFGLAERQFIPKIEHLDAESETKPAELRGAGRSKRPSLARRWRQTPWGRRLARLLEEASKKR
jgi:YidC/Oxa1 family membrane protein insertase